MNRVEVGTSVFFVCDTVTPAKWTFEGNNLSKNAIVQEENFLKIQNAGICNIGYYECEGSATGEDLFYDVGLLQLRS